MTSLPQIPTQPSMLHVLVVDQDDAARTACIEVATSLGYEAKGIANMDSVRSTLVRLSTDIILIDLHRNNESGLETVAEIKALYPGIAVIAMAPVNSASVALAAVHCGASDYLNKPFTVDELASSLERAGGQTRVDVQARQLRERLRQHEGMGQIIGHTAQMDKLYRILSKVAQTTHPVLILGESGTGKELIARTIHTFGPNSEKPFLPVDCGSLVPTLVESELFGYVKGAFTGATHAKDGLLVAAGGGTVFLDEIGELSLDLQAKLLRSLQEREVRPVGATHRIPIKARILTATNRDLAAMVEHGTFRKDLYYRLNIVNLRLPPLRDRRDDIPMLVAHFLNKINKGHPARFSIHDEALRAMMHYDWPGNVRELENAIEHGATMTSGGEIQLGHLPTQLQQEPLVALHAAALKGKKRDDTSLPEILPLAVLERHAILDAIRTTNGDKLIAAKLLGIGKTTLYRKLKEYEISDPLQSN
ncbi:MAG TPA: sigma-54 dependent transcriptional regulator [Terracidiphilus sp.]|nr:sigma-54 dependent transcriptional regulator [Terracidiphilus sp.]